VYIRGRKGKKGTKGCCICCEKENEMKADPPISLWKNKNLDNGRYFLMKTKVMNAIVYSIESKGQRRNLARM